MSRTARIRRGLTHSKLLGGCSAGRASHSCRTRDLLPPGTGSCRALWRLRRCPATALSKPRTLPCVGPPGAECIREGLRLCCSGAVLGGPPCSAWPPCVWSSASGGDKKRGVSIPPALCAATLAVVKPCRDAASPASLAPVANCSGTSSPAVMAGRPVGDGSPPADHSDLELVGGDVPALDPDTSTGSPVPSVRMGDDILNTAMFRRGTVGEVGRLRVEWCRRGEERCLEGGGVLSKAPPAVAMRSASARDSGGAPKPLSKTDVAAADGAAVVTPERRATSR